MRRAWTESEPRNAGPKAGFTLVELLVVIGIIVLLIGILLPVVTGVRKSAYAASSAQQIARLTAAIEAYNSEHRAYPGPLSNDQIIGGGGAPLPTGLTAPVTMSENLALGLMGGLKPGATAAASPAYDEQRLRSRMGPMGLNPLSPKAGHPYFEPGAAELSGNPNQAAKFMGNSGSVEANDSTVPEVVDMFPDALPVIYLRARKGASGVISDNGSPGKFQYDVGQYIGYVKPGGGKTGIGGSGPHGLTALGQPKLITDASVKAPEAPWGNGGGAAAYTAITYFMNPQLTPTTPLPTNATATPRQKDGYILISPGKDRVYGTRDDITNFGGVQ